HRAHTGRATLGRSALGCARFHHALRAAFGGRPAAGDEPRLTADRLPGAPQHSSPARLREASAQRRRLGDLGDAMKVGLVTPKRPAGTRGVGRRGRGGDRRSVGARRAGSPQREQERDDDYRETAHRTLFASQYRAGHQRLLRPGNRPTARSSEGTVSSRPGSAPSLLPSVSIVTNPRAAVGTVSVDSAPRAPSPGRAGDSCRRGRPHARARRKIEGAMRVFSLRTPPYLDIDQQASYFQIAYSSLPPWSCATSEP